MGIYLNPGNENFREVLRRKIYVDKTMMISAINEIMTAGNKYVCISRPRRFGKTIAGNMLSAYFSKGCDSKDLFANLKIAGEPSYECNLNKMNVIKVDMNSEYQNTMDKSRLIFRLTEKIRMEMTKEYPEVSFCEDDSLAECILRIYSATGETFVVILDEYDVLVREQVSEALFQEYLGFLNGLFKSDTLRPAISLAYLTGILPIVRDKIQSKLNNFREYTILDAGVLSEYVGFTADEVKELCNRYGLDYEECKLWYDGYRLENFEIYNPESLVMSIENHRLGNYWSRTSSYEVISDWISADFAGTKEAILRMLSGENVDVDTGTFLNTMTKFKSRNDVFTYLIHLGYLSYDINTGTCRIPNKEVRQEWIRALADNSNYEVTNQIIEESKQLLTDTINGDENAVAKALDISHIHVTSNRSYNNEDALASAVYLAFIYALNEYTVTKEVTAGKGFADVVFVPFKPDKPAMIIELKRNKCTESALDQIKKKQYFAGLQLYHGNLLFVGVNYDETEKTHTCVIERFIKDE